MKPRRVWAVARKEFIHVRRDWRSLGMAVVIPMLLLILFGYALALDVDNVPLVLWDQDGSPASRDLTQRFVGSRYFSFFAATQRSRDLEDALDRRAALAALVIPTHFGSRVGAAQPVDVQLIVDGSDANTATLAIAYAEAVVAAYASASAGSAGGPAAGPRVDLRPRVWYNEDLQSRNYIIPGLIAVIMMVLAALLTSLTVAREWERGTMEQLVASPLTGGELIVGKLLPYFIIGLLDVLLTVVMGQWVFEVPLRGSVFLIFATGAVFLLGSLSLGILVSIATRNQLLASQLAIIFTFLPAFLLSGFVFPIANMPPAIQAISQLIPARYFVALLRGIYLKGVGLEVLWPETLLLAGFGVVMFVIANRRFKKKLM